MPRESDAAEVCSILARVMCRTAREALLFKVLVWDGNDYVMPDMPRRKNGDCMVRGDCPWCGGELPPPEAQADGA